jgi:uncharacterized membrane protein YphA (DoxX/SURF4 family)
MTMQSSRSVAILRISLALFLALWGVDKLVAADGAAGIFSRFYGVNLGTVPTQAFGLAEIALAALLAFGVRPRPVAWVVLLVNLTSMAASWRQILDPWGLLGLGKGGTHLFLASIVITAASVVLVLEADHASSAPESRYAVDGRAPRREL